MGLNPTRLFGNKRGSGVGKIYKKYLPLSLLERKIIFLQTDHSYLFFSYITSVFYNIRRVSYRMSMITFILTLAWHITYRMAYDDSMRQVYITFTVHKFARS